MTATNTNPANPTAMMLLERPLIIDNSRLVETLRRLHPENCVGGQARLFKTLKQREIGI